MVVVEQLDVAESAEARPAAPVKVAAMREERRISSCVMVSRPDVNAITRISGLRVG